MNDLITLPRAVVQQALHVATAAGYPVALIAALKAALAQQEPSDPGSLPVKRSRMEALSKALGHPTQLAVAEGDTAEDALVELAASRLEHSREWRGLTDVEWMNIVNKNHAWFGMRPDEVAHEVCKLTEAALKSKNHEH